MPIVEISWHRKAETRQNSPGAPRYALALDLAAPRWSIAASRWNLATSCWRPAALRWSIAAPRRSIAAPRWRLAVPLSATLAVTLSCGGDATAPTPPPPAPRPTTVSVTPSEVRLAVGDSAQLAAEVRDQNGQVMTEAAVTWSSSDASAATVTSAGLVRGASAGSATIAATAGQASGNAEVTVFAPGPRSDRAALVALYEATSGPGWKEKTDWLTAAPIGQWHGVATDSAGSVVGLDLADNGLAGTLPPELGDLSKLERLALGSNRLVGPIPSELGNLANLEYLSLYRNRLSGRIPRELGDLANLELLSLYRNQLEGPIPPELGSLPSLAYLYLYHNRLSGIIPSDLGDLGNLVHLRLYSNHLSGRIPPELGNLANLEYLGLGNNRLSGRIPPELGDLASLETLLLYLNQLSGPIPSELGSLANLGHLWLFDNQLSGPIPATLLRLDKLEVFHFGNNGGLCAPGTTAFAAWLASASNATGDYCNWRDRSALGALYRSARGTEWSNSDGWRGGPALGEWHGISADSLGRAIGIDLAGNGLVGRLPTELGQLAGLRELRIGDNSQLAGPLPPSLAQLDLADFRYAGTDLCSEATKTFRDWLATVASHQGTGRECSYTDRDVLAALYRLTGGAGWTSGANWLTDAPLGEWHGVTTDDSGSVIGLSLPDNGLAGALPLELGYLSNLERLSLGGNQLAGSIPPKLGSLANLEDLSLDGNKLSGPIPAELGDLANLQNLSLGSNQLSGTIPPELGDLANLERLSLSRNQLDGLIPSELGSLAGLRGLYLHINQLDGPIPHEIGDLANLERLYLSRNQLDGPIPPELGNLADLESLSLGSNQLDGPIPPELGDLGNLASLRLDSNELTRRIPSELGDLGNLADLYLYGNQLSGPIPPELGGIASLADLRLDTNQLEGTIPPELGSLAYLATLRLHGNRLTGVMPAELGGLANLAELTLGNNDLEGPVPAEFGNLAKLEKFSVNNNPEMEGALPASLIRLRMLAEFLASGTALCAPADPVFLRWLDGIRHGRVRLCEGRGASGAYLTQAVQSLDFPVPLVAGEPALLRVFVSASGATGERMPPVRARFYRGGSEVHIANIEAPRASIPASLNEGDLEASANASIPASVVQPGLEMVVEVDPDGTLDASLGIARRIPAEGRATVSVRAVPELDFTIVPFLWWDAPDSAAVRLTTGLAADDATLLGLINTLLPVGDIDLKVHEAVVTASNNDLDLLGETDAIRILEGSAGDSYYMGMISGNVRGYRGLASHSGRASFSTPDPLVMAHELGHNFGLLHAPCGGAAGVDPGFPAPDGTIGAWGYDMRGESLVAPATSDLMSYCEPEWVSDYHFTKALLYRVYEEAAGGSAAVAAGPERALLLWGGVGEGGEPFLEPAFIVDAPPNLPLSPGGEHTVAGHDAGGRELFSLGFDMPALSSGDGRSAFAYALPARQEWAGSLAEIILSGPGGSFTLDKSSDRAAAILRDPLTGQVRGIFRDAPPGVMAAAAMAAPLGPEAAAALSLPPGLEALVSRGLPRPEDWRR